MNRIKSHFNRSLLFRTLTYGRARWLAPDTINYHGVKIQLKGLHPDMKMVIMRGIYENSEISLLTNLISADDVVLEIGGAIGFIGLFLRKAIGVQRLVSVEPNPHTLEHLRRNYQLNGMVPLVIQAALSKFDGEAYLSTSGMFWTDSLVDTTQTLPANSIPVKCLSLDSILNSLNISFTTLVIDIEGGERELSHYLLPKNINKVMIELHPSLIGSRSAYSVLENFISQGFQIQERCNDAYSLIRNS